MCTAVDIIDIMFTASQLSDLLTNIGNMRRGAQIDVYTHCHKIFYTGSKSSSFLPPKTIGKNMQIVNLLSETNFVFQVLLYFPKYVGYLSNRYGWLGKE